MKLKFGSKFFLSAFDSLLEQIAVINQTGEIVFVNKAWKKFGEDNNGPKNFNWIGVNYLQAINDDLDEVNRPLENIRKGVFNVLNMVENEFIVDYPCDSVRVRRWFSMRIAKLDEVLPPLFIVSHFDITERKKKEDEASKLALTDSLTGLPNRRHFTNHLDKEWSRAIRSKSPISCIMIDIDYFKKINDRYGHLIGDECLAQLSMLLSNFTRRETDLVARLGGEEFALIFANAGEQDVYKISEIIREKVMELKVPVISEPITISCGVATIFPQPDIKSTKLLSHADEALYDAKRNGRNQSIIFKSNAIVDKYSLAS